jgi:diacylglycerol kinase (ATP)
MRAAAIFGLGCSSRDLEPFQSDTNVEWRIGMPAANSADVILLFGGDGTIHRHLAQLVKLGLPVLVVPAGSGNDFARALALRNMRDSVAAWQRFCAVQDNVRDIDLGVITPLGQQSITRDSQPGARYFCSVAGVGLDAEVARRANRLPRWLRGRGGYALSLVPTIFRFAPHPMKILAASGAAAADWVVRSDSPTTLAAFANTSTYGGGMKIAPRAKMDDGLLDVCVVGDVNRAKLLGMFPSVYYGKHLSIREVEYFQVSRLRVEAKHPLDVYADGEYVCQTPVEVGVQRNALSVIVHPSQTSL